MDAKRKLDAKNAGSSSPMKGLQVISKYFSSPSSSNTGTNSNRIDNENNSPSPKSPLSKFAQAAKEKQKVGSQNSTQNSHNQSNQNDSDFEDPPQKKQKNNNIVASASTPSKAKPSAKRKLSEDSDFDHDSDDDFNDEVEEPVVSKPAPKKQTKKTVATKKKNTKVEDSDEEEEDDYEEAEDEEVPSKPATGKFEDRYWQGRRAGTIKKRKQKEDEERFPWLANVKDAKGKRPGEDGYDPTTLYIPPDALAKMTPFERQFWDIKKENFDTVIFFKKGKFYELYEGDAEIGHTKLDLKVTDRVNMKMAGVPESHFIPWASKLIKLGYKIGRVDQLETAIGMQKRQKQGGVKSQKDKLIQRELTKVYTIGTLVDEGLINNSNAPYMLSIKEEPQARKYGICLVDASTGEFSLSEFTDDRQRTHLETILVQTKPKEILFEKNNLSSATVSVIKRILYTPLMTPRHAEDFWNAATTVAELNGSEYFKKKPKSLFSEKYDDDMNLSVDDYLRKHMTQNDNDTQDEEEANGAPTGEWAGWPGLITPQGELGDSELVMTALGGAVCYLKELKLDHELLSLKNFKKYDTLQRNTLVIDGQSLVNLEIFENTRDKGIEGTLWKALDQCVTAFGKRLLKKWVCHPLRYIEDIEERLNSIEDLHKLGDKRGPLVTLLKQLPDLERVISRIHAGSCRLTEFVHTLECFDLIQNMVKDYLVPHQGTFRSKRLGIICTLSGLLPFIEQQITEFKKRFDWEKAKSEGTIVVSKGFEQDYDNVQKQIDKCESELQAYLKDMQKRFNDKSMTYKHLNKTLYQIEISSDTVKKQKGGVMPSEFSLTSQTKTVNRYHTDFIKKAVKTLEVEKDNLDDIRRDMVKRQEQRFDAYYNYWLSIVILLGELDCLIALSRTITSADGPSCRPQFVQSEAPFLKVSEMRHPCIKTKLGSDFIPNDLSLGGEEDPNTIILTGPNMGGKSTLLRQTCILVIMAQLGCYVPAESCVLSPVDRIFTRIGANDDIIAGQSTFMVELQETSNIMKNASKHSMVILDELGRGTSTYDGYSIAYAVLDYLVNIKQCRVLFSTHYHKLTQEFEHHKSVGLHHMSCFVDEEQNDVTFLYKLAPGVCPKSYGMNVALMAGIPSYITNRAQEVAKEFEKTSSFAKYHPDAAPQQQNDPMEEEHPKSEATTTVGELIQHLKSNTSEAQRFGKLLSIWKKAHSQQKEQ